VNAENGVKIATVSDVADPLSLGRVLIRLPDAGTETQLWARVAISPEGSRGTVAQLDASDEVVVAFEGGDPRSPIVIGKLWKGDSTPPTEADPTPVQLPLNPLLPIRKVK
jgi:uncharacterized protein involved in type VI secretion and phage assembly